MASRGKLPLVSRREHDASSKATFEDRLSDEARFFKTWFENPLGTGAVSPSGRFLARTMAQYVDPAVPGPVIELGPGTGPVTEALIDRGIAPERLLLVEFEPQFCKLLARRYPGVRIVQGDAYRLAETLKGALDCPASAIVSSLPLRTRPERHRLSLLGDAFRLLRPGAAFVQFTYGIASPMPRPVGRTPGFHAEVSPPVWLNLPPARVWIYRSMLVTGARAPLPEADAEFQLRLKSGTELLGEELREQSDKLKLGIRLRAEKARAELKVQAEKVIKGLNPRHDGERGRPERVKSFDGSGSRGRTRGRR